MATDRTFRPMSWTPVVPTWGGELARLATRSTSMVISAQQVIWARLSMFATRGPDATAQREAQRMVVEKIEAAQRSALIVSKAMVSLAADAPRWFVDPKAADRAATKTLRVANQALDPIEKRVSANRRRLT